MKMSDIYLVPRAQTHRADQRVPRWQIVVALSVGGCQVIIRKTLQWNIVLECHAPFPLNISFVDL